MSGRTMPALLAVSVSVAVALSLNVEPDAAVETCVLEGPGAPLKVQLQVQSRDAEGETVHPFPAGAAEERTLSITVGSAKKPLLTSRRRELAASCERGAVVLTWTRRAALTEDGAADRARVRLVRSGHALVLEPGIPQRLERSWSEGDPEDLAALASLLEELPGSAVKLSPSQIPAARVTAANQALGQEDFTLTETLLSEVIPNDPNFPLQRTWGQRLRTVSARLNERRKQTQPLTAGKPVRLFARKFAPTLPPQPRPDVFWRSAGEACVAQEDRIPATHMRCYDVAKKRWGPREPLKVPRVVEGKLEPVGGLTPCGFVDVCWHPALPQGDDACAGVPCDDVLAVLPQPALVVQRDGRLHAVTHAGEPGRVLPEGVPAETLAGLPGSVLAGGPWYFSGGRLVDASAPRGGRSWKPFHPHIRNAATALVSPDGAWAIVSTVPAGRAKITLWLVPLVRRAP